MRKLFMTMVLFAIGTSLGELASADSTQQSTQVVKTSATLASTCSASATNINFGTINLQNGSYSSATGSIYVQCNANQPFTLTTNVGLYSNGPGRVNLYDPVSKNIMNYGICSNAPTYACSGTGNYSMTNHQFNYVGTGHVQTLPMYAYVLNTFLYTPGTYSDTVTLTFTY
jgi:spore coat protein U-like protein